MSGSFSKSFILFLIVLVAVAGIAFILQSNQTEAVAVAESQKCAECHEMNPEILTWQQSSHRQIACSKCHPDSSVNSMRLNSRGDVSSIIDKNFVSDDVCLGCHSASRSITPPQSLIIPHDLHLTKGVDCVDCHNNVAHGQQDKTASITNEQDAKNLIAFGNRIPMATCMKCHNGTKAPDDCSACHLNKPVPPSHSVANWKTNHGQVAFTDLQGCNSCHEYDVSKQKTANAKNFDYVSLQGYARTNSFCVDCHDKRPPAHNEVFSVAHNKGALTNKQFCIVCHNWDNQSNPNPPATDVVCTKCHATTTHPANWIAVHPTKARGNDAQACFSCHDQQSCTKCHSSRGVNLAQ